MHPAALTAVALSATVPLAPALKVMLVVPWPFVIVPLAMFQLYVVAPPNGTPSVYRVRVGSFRTRREADSLAAKLQKEERFKPWVTR